MISGGNSVEEGLDIMRQTTDLLVRDRDRMHWDESLPQPLESAWTEFCKDFATVGHATFPRYVLQPKTRFEFPSFCDASLQAYGACIYARSFTLLCPKARG
ncbi:GL21972 [Drosophila persimilis]|uniref:GL21972 n=1 Tax=Drosophila persimilis TaxID=7234 RepID=B4GE79_DROPE|nr:GL21972 [Drosophila persimilis]